MGWAAGSAEVIAALTKVKTFMDTGQYLGIQAAGVAALESWDSWVPGNIATFAARRTRAVEAFTAAGFDVKTPEATMYLWIPVPTSESSEAFAARALESEGVILLPYRAHGRRRGPRRGRGASGACVYRSVSDVRIGVPLDPEEPVQ